MSGDLQAYIIMNEYEQGDVFWCKTEDDAEYAGSCSLGGESMACRRSPEFDAIYGKPREKILKLLRMGWTFETEEGAEVCEEDSPFVTTGGDVYKTPYSYLWAAEDKAIIKRNARVLSDWAWGKWWFAEKIVVFIDRNKSYTAEVHLPYLRYKVEFCSATPETVHVSYADKPLFNRLYLLSFAGLKSQLPRLVPA